MSETRKGLKMGLTMASREVSGVTVLDLDGRITLGEGSALLRDIIREKLRSGHRRILINLAAANYMDSSGLGELVSGYRAVKDQGGELKLLNLNKKVTDLLQITKLYTIFDIHTDEAQAVASFKA
jgi:anti-sigma B factor antagonist